VTKGNSVGPALLRSSLPRWVQRALVLLVALLLSACEAELYNNLDQRQANEMVGTLQQRGIPAQRVAVKGGQYTVVVDKGRFAESIAVLKEAGLPKQEFQNMGQVFKKDGLVSSPMQERAQMIFALSQELSRTVSEIDGVLSARVHLVLPENDPLRQQLVPSSASVFIRHRGNMAVGNLVPQVKMLVANGVAGLSYDKVSVVLVPVDAQKASQGQDFEMVSFFGVWMQRDNLAQAMWMFFGLVALVVLLAGALGFVFFRQRGRVYALGSPRAIPSSGVNAIPSSIANAASPNVVKSGSSNVVKAS
jgi:type III secretion protein J